MIPRQSSLMEEDVGGRSLLPDMKAEWITPKNVEYADRVILYLHGGGYA